jgi:type II secretory pathway component PulF
LICPNCKKEVPDGPECSACGIVVAKFIKRQKAPTIVAPPSPPAKPAGAVEAPAETERPWPFRPASDRVLCGLYGQLGRMLEAGIALTEALRLCAQHSRGRLATALSNVRLQVESGKTLAQALSADPAVFPGHVRALVEAGERTGALPPVFFGLAESLELRLAMRRRVLRACFYPFILFTLSFFLIPVSKLFIGGLGAYLRASLLPYVVALLIIAGFLFLLPWGLKKLLGPGRTQGLLRMLPVAGGLYTIRANVRFCRHLSVALGAGLDLFASLRLAAQASGDAMVMRRAEEAAISVQRGTTLADALAATGLFDDEFQLAVSAGEMSGRLEEALDQQARLRQDTFIHRLELVVQLTAVLLLILVYAYVAWSIVTEYQNILGGTPAQLEELMKEVGGGGGGLVPKDLPPELRDILK